MRHVLALVVLALASSVPLACAGTVPKAESDRCKLGISDGNDAYGARQGAACTMVAKRLAADGQPSAALGFARKACELEDGPGCVEYLEIVRGQPSLAGDEMMHARVVGEKACAGMVIANDGADARPLVCIRTAELYADLAPRSPEDAARLFARACKLGYEGSCSRARALGVDPDAPSAQSKPLRNAPAVPQPLPPPVLSAQTTTVVTPPPAPACHEMRPCAPLEVKQYSGTAIEGTLTNKCDVPIACTWCPVPKGGAADKTQCRRATLGIGEQRTSREGGLWFDGYDTMAYDCIDASDNKMCLAL
jgi:hypothetical protein